MDEIEKCKCSCEDSSCKCKKCGGWFKKTLKKDFWKFLILIFGGTVIFLVFYVIAYNQGVANFEKRNTSIQITSSNTVKPVKIDANLFAEVLKTIADRYYGKDKLDGEVLMEGAIKGMVNSLDDPFSEFLNAKDLEELNSELSGSFSGIGAEIGKKDGKIVIIAPLANTPAQKAGIQPQDEIVAVNGASTYGWSTNDVVMKIRGKEGTSVKVTIMRSVFDKPKELTIIRAVINIPSASVEILPNGVALLKIYNFYEPLPVQFGKVLQTIKEKNVKGVIVDLRNDPGGYLDVYTNIGNYFFEKNSILLVEDFKEAQQRKGYKTSKEGVLKDMPMIVLINGGSASAAEILAGALRDNRGIKLVGENSFGKGSVQELINLSGGNQLKLTIAHWLTPKGIDIHKRGLKPDFVVEPSKAMLNSASYGVSDLAIDNQLKKAYDELIKIIK